MTTPSSDHRYVYAPDPSVRMTLRPVPGRARRSAAFDPEHPVRLLPRLDAHDAVALGGMSYALPVAAAAAQFRTSAAKLKRLAKAGEITTSSYRPKEGEPETVIVLDDRTRRTLGALHGAPAEPEPDESAKADGEATTATTDTQTTDTDSGR